MKFPCAFTSGKVCFETSRTTPWEPKITRWAAKPHFNIECYNLSADGKYLGVIYENVRKEEVWCMLQLSGGYNANAEWRTALEDYLTDFTSVDGLAIATG